MKRFVFVLLCALVFTCAQSLALPTDVLAQGFGCPPVCGPPPPDPTPPPTPPEEAKPQTPQNKSDVQVKAAITAAVCTAGNGIFAVGRPVPLRRMSKRQRARYQIEVDRYNRYAAIWGVGCYGVGLATGIPALGVIVPVALIVADDFRMRFITREIPIARTPRQEGLMFCRHGGACPDLTGPDPDLYGPR